MGGWFDPCVDSSSPRKVSSSFELYNSATAIYFYSGKKVKRHILKRVKSHSLLAQSEQWNMHTINSKVSTGMALMAREERGCLIWPMSKFH